MGFLLEQELEQSRQEVIQTINAKANSVAKRAIIHNNYFIIKVISVGKATSKCISSKI